MRWRWRSFSFCANTRRRGRSPSAVLALLEKTAALLPTHTRRSEEGVQLQPFSTPLELAYLASEAAMLRADDVVLEPSAGTGQLAIFAEGVVISPKHLDGFDAPDAVPLTQDEIWQRLQDGGVVHLEPGLTLKRAHNMSQNRIELTGFSHESLAKLKALGMFAEIIAYTTRLFLPTGGDGPKVLAQLLARHTVTQKSAC